MSVEAAVSLSAAWVARSPALLAFGGDSAIELLSAAVVLWSFRAHAVQEHAERRASRIAGILLFVLAAYVVAASALALLGYSEPKPTYLGIAILIAAAAIVPWLASQSSPLPLLSHYQNVSHLEIAGTRASIPLVLDSRTFSRSCRCRSTKAPFAPCRTTLKRIRLGSRRHCETH